MRLTYDPRYKIAYLYLRERPVEVETVKVREELHVDLAPNGTIYGIKLLNANEQLAGIDTGKLRVINDATEKQVEVPLELGTRPLLKLSYDVTRP